MIKLSQMSSLLCTAHGGGAPPVRLFKWPYKGPSTDSGADQPSEGQRKRARMEAELDSGVIHAKPLDSLNKYNHGVSLP